MAPVVDAGRADARREEREQPRHDAQPEVRSQRPAHSPPPPERRRRAQHAEGQARRAQRDGIRPDGRAQRGPERGEDEHGEVVGRPHRPLQRAAHVPEGEGVEGEVQRVLVQEICGEQAPGLPAVEDERGRLGPIEKEGRQAQPGVHPACREEDPDARKQEENRHPGNTRDGHGPGRVGPGRGPLAGGGLETRFFRPSRHLL
jgi:hypothetical protein